MVIATAIGKLFLRLQTVLTQFIAAFVAFLSAIRAKSELTSMQVETTIASTTTPSPSIHIKRPFETEIYVLLESPYHDVFQDRALPWQLQLASSEESPHRVPKVMISECLHCKTGCTITLLHIEPRRAPKYKQ